MNKNIDPNELHAIAGLDELRRQLLSALDIPEGGGVSPAPPAAEAVQNIGSRASAEVISLVDLEYEGKLSLVQCLERFVLTIPDAKIWDIENKELIRQSAAKLLMTKKTFDHWIEHEERRCIHQDMVRPIAEAAAEAGGGLGRTLERYIYLYPTNEVWDVETREIVSINNLRVAIADCFERWVKSSSRRQINQDRLVFDPTRQVNPDTHINRFRGLPLVAKRDDSKCTAILALADHLCNGRRLELHWLLCWLAYPLQNIGAKMDTAILMHSPQEGTGKSLFFNGVINPMYGEYGATVGQHQLESQYSEWRSCLLYALFEEVLSRDQKFNYTGALKHMITGTTQRLEKKFVSSWEEANHMNSVFLSNEIQPWPLDDSDRRMQVLWPKNTLTETDAKAVKAEIDSGGIEAFIAYLLAYPLKWPARDMVPALEEAAQQGDATFQGFIKALPDKSFDERSKPLMNKEKVRLIDCGRPSWEVFFRAWLDGDLHVPRVPCLTQDLFAVFRTWADKGRENVISHHRFCNFVAKVRQIQKRDDVRYAQGQNERKGRFFVPINIDEKHQPNDGETQAEYFGRCVVAFQSMMKSED